MGRPSRRWRDERGTAVIESLGMLPYLALAALAGWQLLLAVASVGAVEQAARTGGRVAAAGGDGAAAALEALPSFLSAGDARAGQQGTDCARAGTAPAAGSEAPRLAACGRGSQAGGTVRLTVRAPLVLPGVDTGALTITRSASFPLTERRGR